MRASAERRWFLYSWDCFRLRCTLLTLPVPRDGATHLSAAGAALRQTLNFPELDMVPMWSWALAEWCRHSLAAYNPIS